VRPLLQRHGLALAAAGTGAGWVVRRLHLCHEDAAIRARAREFIAQIIDAAAALGAPAIIGSMQGRVESAVAREQALDWLAEALADLGARAALQGQFLLYEPLNRYETNLFNRLEDAAAFLEQRGLAHVRLLADLFHMNIEESDLEGALRAAAARVGHVHFADSNRRAIGFGHAQVEPVAAALRAAGYTGYVSAEILPWPDPAAAARQTIHSYRRWFGPATGIPCSTK
jgi:sugar phosphate isomerase/epimerase